MPTPDALDPVLRRITGRTPVAWDPRDEGAYSYARRWVVTWAEGGSAFVKAERKAYEHHGVALEHLVYAALDLPCLPRLHAYDPGPPLVLVTEDLSHASWGTPVTAADATALRTALDSLAAAVAPGGLPEVAQPPRWAAFAADPAPLIATGLADEQWVAAHVPVLAEAERGADVRGDAPVHGDVWLQNWCRADRGVVVVDWGGARRGNPLVNHAGGEAAVRAADGPPGLVLAGRPEWAAWLAGQAAWFLSEEPPDAPERLVETERREALASLRWAAEELGLPRRNRVRCTAVSARGVPESAETPDTRCADEALSAAGPFVKESHAFARHHHRRRHGVHARRAARRARQRRPDHVDARRVHRGHRRRQAR